jgi:hypothetical protein
VAERLSRLVHNAVKTTHIKGIHIHANFSLSHLLFVDNIAIVCQGKIYYIELLKRILLTFYIETSMQVNMEKYSLYCWGLSEQEKKKFSLVLDL